MCRLVISCPMCMRQFLGSIDKVVQSIRCAHCGATIPYPNAAAGEPLYLMAQGNEPEGPFTRAQLAELAATQQLTRDVPVRVQGTTTWMTAGQVPRLFPAVEEEQMPKLVLDSALEAQATIPDATSSASNEALAAKKNSSTLGLSLGDFQVLRKLGSGGMGAVYLALQRSTVHRVALKVLPDFLAQKQGYIARFLREVEILAGLHHPNIVKFLGAGLEKDVPFLVMELIEGISTAVLVRQRGRLNVGDALYVIRQIAEAMNYAFSQKIVHRDIKPENILVTRLGQVKLADLGLAKSLDAPPGDSDLDLTGSGTGLGSPKYMAPEQTHGAKSADQRSDIYGLGGVLYFLLTAEAPFKGTSAMELLLAKQQKLFTPARRLNPEVPALLDLIIDKTLAKEPKYRYQNWTDLIHDLDRLALTNPQLSFDPKEMIDPSQDQLPHELVEILMIDNDDERIQQARQALADNRIAGELVVVRDGAEARAFLRREGKHLLAPQPNLIFFGPDLDPADSLLTLEEIRVSDALSGIPLVLLANSPATGRFLASRGYRVNLIVNLPGDAEQFSDLFTSIRSLCLTVMELKTEST